MAKLDVFGVLGRSAHRHGNVVGHLIPGDRDDGGVADRTAGEHRDVGGTAPDVDYAHTQFPLIICQAGETGSQLLQDDVLDRQTATLHTLDDVLGGTVS